MNREQARQIARDASTAWWNSDDDDRDEYQAMADAIYDAIRTEWCVVMYSIDDTETLALVRRYHYKAES